MMMISFVVGRGMGHLGRCICIMDRFGRNEENLRVHAFSDTHHYLTENLPENCKIKKYEPGHLQGRKRSNVIIHDWRPEIVDYRKNGMLRNGTKLISLYHSDFEVNSADSEKMKKFKKHIQNVANGTDVFLHMNLLPPKRLRKKLNCIYIPIPLITRVTSKSPEQVKRKLGLRESKSFILVHMGSGLGQHRYKGIEKWYKVIDALADQYQFVVAGQLEAEEYKFNKRVIQAPLFANGKDLVQAADLVITKPGMGILGDCISTQTPILMLPADNSERKQKIQMLEQILGSSVGTLKRVRDIQSKIETALEQKKHFVACFEKIPTNGAEVAYQIIQKVHEMARKDLKKRSNELKELSPYSHKAGEC
jgi:hypothetical protein